jgi:hypothetical protein
MPYLMHVPAAVLRRNDQLQRQAPQCYFVSWQTRPQSSMSSALCLLSKTRLQREPGYSAHFHAYLVMETENVTPILRTNKKANAAS